MVANPITTSVTFTAQVLQTLVATRITVAYHTNDYGQTKRIDYFGDDTWAVLINNDIVYHGINPNEAVEVYNRS